MANRAYLLTVDDKSVTWSKNPKQEILAEGINEIPVFWASLFRPEDRQVDEYEGGDGKLKLANWCADRNAVKARLKSRRPTIAALLDDRSRGLREQWVEFVSAQACQYFKTNAAEVWSLHPDDGYEAYWAVLLRAFEEPSVTTMKAAIEANDLSYFKGKVLWDDDEVTTCKLAGATHIRDLPWLALRSKTQSR